MNRKGAMTEIREFRKHILDIISEFSGQNKMLSIPRFYIELCGDIPTALLLSQLIYWTDKTKRSDCFIFKTYKEWHSELGLSESQVRRGANKLKKMGILTTKIRKAMGAPTVHYKIQKEKFEDLILKKVKNRSLTNERNQSEERPDSSNRDYDIELNNRERKNTSQNCDAHKSFNIFRMIKSGKDIDQFVPEISEKIRQYLNEYYEVLGKDHPNISDDQMSNILDAFDALYEKTDFIEHRSFDELLSDYFQREDINTDYNINHFAAWINGLAEKIINYYD